MDDAFKKEAVQLQLQYFIGQLVLNSIQKKMKLEEKIDLILKKLDFIENRLDDIDSKYDYLSSRIDDLEEKVKSRNLKVDNLLSTKSDSETIQKLNEKISIFEKFKLVYDKTTVMQESYAKRLNILVHGIKEDHPWEKRGETVTKFQNFLKVKLDEPDDIEFVDIHRLSQHPISTKGKAIDRPIIVMLLTMEDKTSIFKSVRNLKTYNEKCKRDDDTSAPIYVTEHQPKKFREQRKLLLPLKEAKIKKQKTLWKAMGGNYVLFVNGKKVKIS